MRICVRLPDPLLRRALVDLLRSEGHVATAADECGESVDLRISTRGQQDPESPPETLLLLQRGIDPVADQDPRKALTNALAEKTTAVWRAPLDTRLLLDILGRRDQTHAPTGSATEGESAAEGGLQEAPHPWLQLDAATGHVTEMNDLAQLHFGLRPDQPYPMIRDLPIPQDLAEALTSDSEGVRFDEINGRGQVSVWWTSRNGARMACLIDAMPAQSAAARHRQSLAELGTMAATLAHEIRNPVASLAGALDLLESETDPDDRAEVLVMARERVHQLARLLDKTLTLSRPISGPAESVELRPALDSALSNLSLNPAFENIEVVFDMPSAAVPIEAYEGPLIQALTNLLLNAAQAQDGKGKIQISLERSGRWAVLRICDEGPGIPKEKRLEIFKPFYTTRAAGTGLGLAEVRRAVNAMGGSVSLEDCEGGACFRIELPLVT